MTPKEKALRLCQSFGFLGMEEEQTQFNSLDISLAKKCAMICADEILKNFEGLHKPEYCKFDAIGDRKFTFEGEYPTHITGYEMVTYWDRVKIEIEKL